MPYTNEQREDRLRELMVSLRAAEGRVTPQRMAIIRALLDNERHPSAEDIYREIKPIFPTMSFATVYKTLDRLKSMDEVLELEFSDGGNRYDGMRPEPHPHLVCTSCGAIADADLGVPEELLANIVRQASFHLEDTRFDLYGICRDCRTSTGS